MKAENAVQIARLKQLVRMINSIKKQGKSEIDFCDDDSETILSIKATSRSYKQLNSYIRNRVLIALITGAVLGLGTGLFIAYVVLPIGGTYLYSSEKGLLPPKYDALFASKEPHMQITQLLTHEYPGKSVRRGGPHKGKQMCYRATINDSTYLELWYKLTKKSLITNISQEKGAEFIKSTIHKNIDETGVDSAAKYYAGMNESSIANSISDAASRTSSMKVEQGFLSSPVIRIVINGKSEHIAYTNFLPWEDRFDGNFTSSDADMESVTEKDHTTVGRNSRVPTPEDQRKYRELQSQFLRDYFNTAEKK